MLASAACPTMGPVVLAVGWDHDLNVDGHLRLRKDGVGDFTMLHSEAGAYVHTAVAEVSTAGAATGNYVRIKLANGTIRKLATLADA